MSEHQATNGIWLIEEWAKSFAEVMETMTGERPVVACEPESGSDAAGGLWWAQPFSILPGSPIFVGASAEAWQEIGKQVLMAAGVDDGDHNNRRTTYFEVLSQCFSGIAQTLSVRIRQDISLGPGRETDAGKAGIPFTVRIDFGPAKVTISMAVPEALLQALETPQPPPPQDARTTNAAAEEQPPHSLDLLLDVELPVSVSFGRAQLPLKDVIKLTTGSIVELNRTVNEPVEVIINNCVIARGEVVVVEGNFGIRIKQIVSRQDRLRTLK